jgi:hypothetical protein
VVEAVNMTLRGVPLLIVALCAVPPAAFAHVLDEYLQSTLVAIEPGEVRLKINLTPGVEVADKILAQIDRDRDGVISNDEAAAYSEVLQRDLTVRMDGRDIGLKLTESNIPELAELRTGHGIIQVEFSITPGSFSAGPHRLSFENRHFNSFGVYLFNAARPRSASIQIARQNRNSSQSTGEIEFAYDAPSHSSNVPGFVALFAVILLVTVAAVWRIRRSSRHSIWALQDLP